VNDVKLGVDDKAYDRNLLEKSDSSKASPKAVQIDDPILQTNNNIKKPNIIRIKKKVSNNK